LRNPTTGKP
jgi:hypothetical protein